MITFTHKQIQGRFGSITIYDFFSVHVRKTKIKNVKRRKLSKKRRAASPWRMHPLKTKLPLMRCIDSVTDFDSVSEFAPELLPVWPGHVPLFRQNVWSDGTYKMPQGTHPTVNRNVDEILKSVSGDKKVQVDADAIRKKTPYFTVVGKEVKANFGANRVPMTTMVDLSKEEASGADTMKKLIDQVTNGKTILGGVAASPFELRNWEDEFGTPFSFHVETITSEGVTQFAQDLLDRLIEMGPPNLESPDEDVLEQRTQEDV